MLHTSYTNLRPPPGFDSSNLLLNYQHLYLFYLLLLFLHYQHLHYLHLLQLLFVLHYQHLHLLLMSRRSKEDYIQILQYIRTRLPGTVCLSRVVMDFEPAVWGAFCTVFFRNNATRLCISLDPGSVETHSRTRLFHQHTEEEEIPPNIYEKYSVSPFYQLSRYQ